MNPQLFGFSLHSWIVANLVASAYMTGLTWFVQVVHYPLFAKVGDDGFAVYEQLHATRTGWVVAPVMLFELAVSATLAFGTWHTSYATWASISLALVIVAWFSTFALQVPCHNRLHQGYDASVQQRLVRTNWLRTVAWTVRTAVLVFLLVRV